MPNRPGSHETLHGGPMMHRPRLQGLARAELANAAYVVRDRRRRGREPPLSLTKAVEGELGQWLLVVGAVDKGFDLLARGKPQGLRRLQATFVCAKLEETKMPLAK